MNRTFSYLLVTVALATYSTFAAAGTIPTPSIPEPDTIALLATGIGAIALVSRWRGHK